MNPLKQRELCGEARPWWMSQHDSESGGDPTFRHPRPRWEPAQLSLFFSV
jgi:hypothetical protein